MEKDVMVLDQSMQNTRLTKWLCVLFYAEVVSLVILLAAMVPMLEGVITWISLIASAAVLVALYQLSPVHERYRKSSRFYLVAFLGSLVQAFTGSNILTSAAGICGIVASYQEYNAHSELLNVKDNQLSGKWNALFYWEIAAGLIGGFAAMAVAVLGVGAGMEESLLVILGVAVVAVLEVPLSLLRLRYLKKTIGCFMD